MYISTQENELGQDFLISEFVKLIKNFLKFSDLINSIVLPG